MHSDALNIRMISAIFFISIFNNLDVNTTEYLNHYDNILSDDSIRIEKKVYESDIDDSKKILIFNLFGQKNAVLLLLKNDEGLHLLSKFDLNYVHNVKHYTYGDNNIIEVEVVSSYFCGYERYLQYYNVKGDTIYELNTIIIESIVSKEQEYCNSDYSLLIKYCNLIFTEESIKLECLCEKDTLRYNEEYILYEDK